MPRAVKTLGREALTVSTASVAPTIPAETTMFIAVVKTAAIRFRSDGTAPTAAVGHPLEVGDVLNFADGFDYRQFLTDLKLIRRDAVDAVVEFLFLG